MREIEFSLNNATQVWWFMAWRSVLVYFFIVVPVTWVMSGWFAPDSPWVSIVELVGTLILLFAQVFFIKLAVNRDYHSKSTGNFRLNAVELDGESRATSESFSPETTTNLDKKPLPIPSFAPHSVTEEKPNSAVSFAPESVSHEVGEKAEDSESSPSPFTPKNIN